MEYIYNSYKGTYIIDMNEYVYMYVGRYIKYNLVENLSYK